MWFYFVVQCIRHLMGQPLYCSAADAGLWEREAMVMAPPLCMTQQWLPGFPPQAFPTAISSLKSLPSVSPQSTAALALGLLCNPYTPAPSHCAFQETSFPVWDMYGCGKDCLILIPFRLPQISCFTLSLKLTQTIAPLSGLDPCFSSPTKGQVQSY